MKDKYNLDDMKAVLPNMKSQMEKEAEDDVILTLLGNRLGLARSLKGYTHRQMAEKAGISWPYYKQMEYGSCSVPIDRIVKLCQITETNPNFFFLESEELKTPDKRFLNRDFNLKMIGELLEKAMNESKLETDEFMLRLWESGIHMSSSRFERIKRGKLHITTVTFVRICKVLEITPDRFFMVTAK